MTRPAKERKPRAKKTTTVVEEIPTQEIEDEGPSELDFNLEEVRDTEKLTEVLDQFPDAGITVKIYDQHGAYRFTPPDPRNIDPELIRLRCGAGNFVGRVYVNGKYRQSIDIPIGEVNPDPNAPKSAPVVDSHSAYSAFLEKMLLTLLARETPHIENNKAPSLTDMVQSLGVLDGLRGKQESGLEMYIKGMEMGRGLDSGGVFDWKEQLFRIVAQNAPALMDGVSAIIGGAGNRNKVPPNPIPQNAAPPNPAEIPPEEKPVQIPDAYFKEGIAFIKQRLLAGMETDTIINWVYDNRDDQSYQPFLKEILSKPFEFFVKLDEEISNEPFRSKFLAIYNGIRSLFNEEYEMELDTGGSGGNPDNSGSNGKPSEKGSK